MDICNCACCRSIRMAKFWYAITCRKFPNTETANVHFLFDFKSFVAKRPSVLLLESGLESLDFIDIENKTIIEEAESKGFKYVNKDFFFKYIMLIIIGILVGVAGGLVTSIGYDLICRKNKFLRDVVKSTESQVGLLYFYLIGFSLVPAIIGSAVVAFIEPEAGGGGLASICAYINGNNIHKALSLRTLVIILVSTILMSLASLPGGLGDPIIHMGAIIGANFPLLKFPFTNKRIFPIFIGDADIKDFVLAGLAAAYAAFFGAPLGGMVWVMEIFVFNWTGDMFIKILICSFTSSTVRMYMVSWYSGTKGVISRSFLFMFNASTFDTYVYTFDELVPCILFGCMGGILGIIWNLFFKGVMTFRRRFIKHPIVMILEVAVITILDHFIWITLYLYYPRSCSLIPFLSDTLCDARKELINMNNRCDPGTMDTMGMFLFNELHFTLSIIFDRRIEFMDIGPMITIGLVSFVQSFFYGSKISSGLFVPVWEVGAIFGRVISLITHNFLSEDYSNRFMGVLRSSYYGSVSFQCGVFRSAAAICITFWEATSNTILEFPMFVVVIVSKFTAELCIPNVYSIKNEVFNLPILKLVVGNFIDNLSAKDLMNTTPLVTLNVNSTLKRLIEVSFETRHNGFPVVNPAINSRKDIATFGRMEGLIIRSQILRILQKKWLELTNLEVKAKKNIDNFRKDFVNVLPTQPSEPVSFDINASVNLSNYMDDSPASVLFLSPGNQVYQIFTSLGLRHLPVVNKSNEIAGIITRKDLIVLRKRQYLWL